MATIDAPFGFKPIGSLGGGAYNGAVIKCAVDGAIGTDVFIGDFVELSGGGTVAGTQGATTTGLPEVIAITGATTNPIFGAVVSFAHDPTNLESQFFDGSATSNDRVCYVVPATANTYFIAQEDGSTLALLPSDIGSMVDVLATVPTSATYGISAQEIQSSSVTTGATLGQVRLMGLYQSPENETNLTTTAGTIWVVQVAEYQLGTTVLAVGQGV